jgi:hypothetical protein
MDLYSIVAWIAIIGLVLHGLTLAFANPWRGCVTLLVMAAVGYYGYWLLTTPTP